MKTKPRHILLALLCFLSLSARPSDTLAAPLDIVHTAWYSHQEKIYRRVDIYIPAAIRNHPSESGYPVLYLLHGINGYEGSWQDKGRVTDTLEAYIASGRCRPMILVMPDCNKWPFKKRPVDHGNLWKCVLHYSKLSHEHELEYALSDLIDHIDTTYRVSTCAVAGLSDGARMAANVANRRPDRIRSVGLFSPVIRKEQLPKDTTQMYAIYVGKNDMFFANGERFSRRMRKAGNPYQWIEIPGNHNWHLWRQCYQDFLLRL